MDQIKHRTFALRASFRIAPPLPERLEQATLLGKRCLGIP